MAERIVHPEALAVGDEGDRVKEEPGPGDRSTRSSSRPRSASTLGTAAASTAPVATSRWPSSRRPTISVYRRPEAVWNAIIRASTKPRAVPTFVVIASPPIRMFDAPVRLLANRVHGARPAKMKSGYGTPLGPTPGIRPSETESTAISMTGWSTAHAAPKNVCLYLTAGPVDSAT